MMTAAMKLKDKYLLLGRKAMTKPRPFWTSSDRVRWKGRCVSFAIHHGNVSGG